jgi:hypothetical protein
MKKYGFDNFKFEVVDNINSKNLNEKEKYFIHFYDSNNILVGYNMTLGGDGGDTMSSHINKKEIYEKRKENYSGSKVIQYRHDLDKFIIEMNYLNSIGWSANDLSKKFNCSAKAVKNRIINYKNISSSNHHSRKNTYQYRHDLDEKFDEILKLKNTGIKIEKLCKIYNCSKSTFYRRFNENKIINSNAN